VLPRVLQLVDAGGAEHRIVLLSQQQADACGRHVLAGRERLLLSDAALHVEGDTAVVLGGSRAQVRGWPADDLRGGDGFAAWERAGVEADELPLRWHVEQDAQVPPVPRDGPLVSWRARTVPLAPADAAYEQGMRVRLEPGAPCPAGTRVLLTLDYIGDAARLLADGRLVDDQFADGEPWIIGLHRFARPDGSWPRLELQIVPANSDLPIFLEPFARERLRAAAPQRAGVTGASARALRRASLRFQSNEVPRWLD